VADGINAEDVISAGYTPNPNTQNLTVERERVDFDLDWRVASRDHALFHWDTIRLSQALRAIELLLG
jgi:hypothetical protein